MSVSNVKYPLWFVITCEEKVLADIICTNSTFDKIQEVITKIYVSSLSIKTITECDTTEILYEEACYLFHEQSDKLHKNTKEETKGTKSFHIVLQYFSRVSTKSIVFRYDTASFKYNRVTGNIEEIQQSLESQHQVINVTTFPQRLRKTQSERFQLQLVHCEDGRLISVKMLCRERILCRPKGPNTTLWSMLNNALKLCPNLNHSSRRTCPDLHYISSQGHCLPFSTKCGSLGNYCEMKVSLMQDTQFSSAIVINASNKNPNDSTTYLQQVDLFADCNEYEVKNITAEPGLEGCEENNTIQCTYRCKICFPFHKLCVHELDKASRLMHCPSGAHLKNCEEMECSNMLKCYKSYCVPYR